MKNVLPRKLMIELSDLLRAHCHQTPDGHAEYDAPWTDEIIATTFGQGVHADHVSRLRRDLLGKFVPTTNILNQYQLKDYILELTKKVDRLQTELDQVKHWASQRPRAPFGTVQ